MVQLSDELIEHLDREASRRGVSRSALIRDAVAAFLLESHEAEIARRVVHGYQRIPQGEPDEWGDLVAMTDHTNRELLQRLDEEERSQGLPPW